MEFYKKLIDEINKVRKDPNAFAEKLLEYKKYFKGNFLVLPGSIDKVETQEGFEAYEEAADFLKSMAPLPEIAPSKGLRKIAADFFEKIKETDQNNISDINMNSLIKKYGSLSGIFENIIDFENNSPEMIVTNCIVCDGNPERENRNILLSKDLLKVGMAFGTHATYGYGTIILLCTEFKNDDNSYDLEFYGETKTIKKEPEEIPKIEEVVKDKEKPVEKIPKKEVKPIKKEPEESVEEQNIHINKDKCNDISYNCTECSSLIEIISLLRDNNFIKFKCLNKKNNHEKILSIKEYLQKMKNRYNKQLNDDICKVHTNKTEKYVCYCFRCKNHLCTECLKSRIHLNHNKNDIKEIQPIQEELNIMKEIIIDYKTKVEKLKNENMIFNQNLNKSLNDKKSKLKKIFEEQKQKIKKTNLEI